MSLQSYQACFPKGVPRKSKDFGKVFLCRRGCDYKSGTFTDEFIWEDRYQRSESSAIALLEWVENTTKTTRPKRRRRFKKDDYDDGGNFVVSKHALEDDGEIRTPRKRQKSSTISTPQKARTPSRLFTPSHKRFVCLAETVDSH